MSYIKLYAIQISFKRYLLDTCFRYETTFESIGKDAQLVRKRREITKADHCQAWREVVTFAKNLAK